MPSKEVDLSSKHHAAGPLLSRPYRIRGWMATTISVEAIVKINYTSPCGKTSVASRQVASRYTEIPQHQFSCLCLEMF
jgi:hypothetical protein